MRAVISILLGNKINEIFKHSFDDSYYKYLDFRLNQKHINFTGLTIEEENSLGFLHYAVEKSKIESSHSQQLSVEDWIVKNFQDEYNQIFPIGSSFQSLSFVLFVDETIGEYEDLFFKMENALNIFQAQNNPIGGIDYKLVFFRGSNIENDFFSYFQDKLKLSYSSIIPIGKTNRNGLVIEQNHFTHNFIIEFSWFLAISTIPIVGRKISIGFNIVRIKPKWVEYIIDLKILELWEKFDDKQIIDSEILYKDYIKPFLKDEITFLESGNSSQDVELRYEDKNSEFYIKTKDLLVGIYKNHNLKSALKSLDILKSQIFISTKTDTRFIDSSPSYYSIKNFPDFDEKMIPLRENLLLKIHVLKGNSRYKGKDKQTQIDGIKSLIIERFEKKQLEIEKLSSSQLTKIKTQFAKKINLENTNNDVRTGNKDKSRNLCTYLKKIFVKTKESKKVEPLSKPESATPSTVKIENLHQYIKCLPSINKHLNTLDFLDTFKNEFIELEKIYNKNIKKTHQAIFEVNPIDEEVLLENIENYFVGKNLYKIDITEVKTFYENLKSHLNELRETIIRDLKVKLDIKDYLNNKELNDEIHKRINQNWYVCFNQQTYNGTQSLVFHPQYNVADSLNFIPQGAAINNTDIHANELVDKANMIIVYEWGW
jgi:hypothetical protein